MKKLTCTAFLLAAAASPAQASVTEEAIFLADLPTVLTASRIEQSALDAPAPVTVIDRDTIRASGFTEIHDLLRLVPGFQVADWAGGGAVVANHGLGSAYPHTLLVLLDGRSVVDPVTGGVDWQDLPVRLEDVERIEVVRGPNQASYGALAFNGVVNIITRLPGEDDGAGLVFSRGERGFADNYVRLGRRGETYDWRLSASDRRANPFRYADQPNYYSHEVNQRQTLRAEFAYRPGLDQEVSADLGLTWGRDDLGSTVDPLYANGSPSHERDIASRFLQVVWRKTYDAGSELSLRYFHYRRDKQEAFLALGGAVLADYDIDTRRDDLELQQVHRFSDSLQGVWGGGVRRDWIDSPHYFYGAGPLDGIQWQVFGNLDWRIAGDWLLHAGTMVERHYNTGRLLSPRLALNYAISPSQSLRVSVGKGYRAPTLLETDAFEVYTTPDGIPVPISGLRSSGAIEPEQVRYRDIGYVGRFDRLGLQLDARLYAETYSDLVWAPRRVFRNIVEDVQVRGGELSLDWQHTLLGRFRVSHAVIDVTGGEGINDLVEQSAPERSTSLLWSKALPWGLVANLGYYRVGEMAWLGDGSSQPAYERVDVKLAKRFGRPGSEDEIALTVQNLNGRHLEFQSGARANYSERQAFVTLRLGW